MRERERLDRLQKYYGDMFSRTKLKKIIRSRDFRKRDINRACREILEELGYTDLDMGADF